MKTIEECFEIYSKGINLSKNSLQYKTIKASFYAGFDHLIHQIVTELSNKSEKDISDIGFILMPYKIECLLT